MPNGFHGSEEEWREMEAPYIRIDPILQEFARRRALAVMKNYRDADRSLRFNDSLARTIWINAAGAKGEPTFAVSVVAYQDRPQRFLKTARVSDKVPIPELKATLDRAVELVSSWKAADLEPASQDRTEPSGWAALKRFLDPLRLFDFLAAGRPVAMKEDRISRYADGSPHLPEYTESLAYYQDMYGKFLSSSARRLEPRDSNLAWRQRIHGTYGLIARGAESLPYVLRLLRDTNADAREDAATILAGIAPSPGSVDALLAALASEEDSVVRTAIIEALGATRSRQALVALESLRVPAEDPDTREAVERALGRLKKEVAD